MTLNDIDIESMQHIVEKEKQKGNLKVLYKHMVAEGTPGKMVWDNGTLYYRAKSGNFELLLYHLISYKKMPFSKKNIQGLDLYNKFNIDKYSFYINSYNLNRYSGYINKSIFLISNIIDFHVSRFLNIKRKFDSLKGSYTYENNKVLIVKHIDGNYYLSHSNSVLNNESFEDVLSFNMLFRKNAIGYIQPKICLGHYCNFLLISVEFLKKLFHLVNYGFIIFLNIAYLHFLIVGNFLILDIYIKSRKVIKI